MYYIIENWKDSTGDYFVVGMTNNFYRIMNKYYDGGSYHDVCFRLFGLLPGEYYKYISATYGAKLRRYDNSQRYVRVLFSNRNEAQALIKELNERMSYCVKMGFFNQ